MSETLEQVLADEREATAILRRTGNVAQADDRERLLERVSRAAEPFLRWLSEGDAMLRSDRSRVWFRARFAEWAQDGLARWNPRSPRERQYLECVVPRRGNASASYEAGRDAARRAS